MPKNKWHRVIVSTPLETFLNGMTKVCRSKQIKVESTSANCIILDEEPDMKCSSLLVAYRTDLLPAESSQPGFILRHTSLFPKIKGIVSICLMAFSPQVELRLVAFAPRKSVSNEVRKKNLTHFLCHQFKIFNYDSI
jgi:hypothetical protein